MARIVGPGVYWCVAVRHNEEWRSWNANEALVRIWCDPVWRSWFYSVRAVRFGLVSSGQAVKA